MRISAQALILVVLSAPAQAVTGGKLGTLERGTWVCEMPGDAGTQRGIPVPEAGFVITPSSTYRTETGTGIYLRTGDSVSMTSGPHKGVRFTVQNERMLKRLAGDGKEDGMRCIKLGATTS